MTPTTRQESAVIAAVEDFIRDFHNGDLVLSPKANRITLTIPDKRKSVLGIKFKKQNTLANMLAWAIAGYQLCKDSTATTQQRIEQAYECLDFIERARTYGVVIPRKLTSDLKKCQEQNARLKELNDKLAREQVNDKKLIAELHKTIDRLSGKGLQKAGGTKT